MKVLIIGAAGMIGRKLTARLVRDGKLAGKAITHAHLVDVVAPQTPPNAPFAVALDAFDIAASYVASKLVAPRPDVIFLLASVVSGEAEADFDKGYAINLGGTHAIFEAIRREQALSGGAYRAPPDLHLLDRGLWRAVPRQDRRRVSRRSTDQLRHPEGDLRTPACRLFEARLLRRRRAAPADDLRSPRLAQQGGFRVFLRHHPRAARRQGGDPAGRRRRSSLARLASRGDRVPLARGGTRSLAARLSPLAQSAGRERHGRGADRGACAPSPATRRSRSSAASPTRRSSESSRDGRVISIPRGPKASDFKRTPIFRP